MIHTIIADIAAKLQAQLPWVKSTCAIARQDPSTGVILIENPEEYAGIDDRRDGRLYFRFREGWETLYTDARMVSGPDTTTTKRMRAVLTHFCDNEHEIARFTGLALMNARNHAMRYEVRLRTDTTDKQFIIAQEAKVQAGTNNDRIRLWMVDFDVTFRDAVLTGEPTCLPTCHVC